MHRFTKRLQFEAEKAQKIYGLIGQIEELKGQWKAGVNLSPQILGILKKSVIVTSTGASTRIEGAKLTDEQVEKLLKGIKIQSLKTRDEQEVAGYAELLSNIFDSYKSLKVKESTIKHFHNEVLKYSDKDKRHKGNYKFGSNRVEAKDQNGNVIEVLFDPTPPYLVHKEISELVDFTNEQVEKREVHALLLTANFIFEFLSIHPFQDGNGRTSRILTTLLLLKSGYGFVPYVSHEKLIEDNKADYYIALNKSQKTWKKKNEDITPWLEFFLEIIFEQSKRAINLLSNESIEHLLSEKQMNVWQFIQERKTVTPREIREALKIPTPTVLQILNKLLDMRKIERLGEGRGVRYKIK